jgi:ubiquinone/menaquinone biosynthesis C-methylase UbiE
MDKGRALTPVKTADKIRGIRGRSSDDRMRPSGREISHMHQVPSDTAALFEDPAAWQAYEGNRYLEERTRIVLSMLPKEARTAADVGCGNGILVHALDGADRKAIGIDPSRTALRAFDLPRACARGEKLPLRARAVDLVACLEVLEHLTDEGVRACAAELMRISRRWILVGVPEREDPMRNALRCPRCGTIFNRSHHLQSFDVTRLIGLFPGFEATDLRRGGQPVRPYPAPLLRIRHRLAHRFFKGPGETHGLCPKCGNRDFPPFRPNLLSITLDGFNRLISRRRPYWILVLLERHLDGSIGGTP